MLEMAAQTGTTDIVATPHADLEYKFEPAVIRQRVIELQNYVGQTPRIYEGCDFHLTYENIKDALNNPAKYTINHKNYLLVEFSDLIIFQNSTELFLQMQEAGIHPVITHPERNPLLLQRIHKLRQWVLEGTYLQVTAGSLLGHFGTRAKKFSLELIKENLVHFIASDGHDTQRRPPTMKAAYEWMERHYSQALADRLFVENPRAALVGAAVPPLETKGLTRPKIWYRLWA